MNYLQYIPTKSNDAKAGLHPAQCKHLEFSSNNPRFNPMIHNMKLQKLQLFFKSVHKPFNSWSDHIAFAKDDLETGDVMPNLAYSRSLK